MAGSRLEYQDGKPARDWAGLINIYAKTFSARAQRATKHDKGDRRPKWIFRGQRDHWELDTSLDRAFAKYGIIPRTVKDEDTKKAVERQCRAIEEKMLRSFMRKAHHYLTQVPELDDIVDWLAMMRHYGAPTRLLDWTYSFYVAVYNAVEDWNPSKTDPDARRGAGNSKKHAKENGETQPVVWALDAAWLRSDPVLSMLERRVPVCIDKTRHEQNDVVRHLMTIEEPMSLVYSATGFRLNERLIAQQGTFLVQGMLAKSFSENLRMSLGDDPKKHFYQIHIQVDGLRRDEILCELNNMNINHATLYPDLGGFAKSLERHMAYPENWGLDVKKEYT